MEVAERTAKQARIVWGEVLDSAIAGKITRITRNGRLSALVIPPDVDEETLKRILASRRAA